jgi:hypothetical protein
MFAETLFNLSFTGSSSVTGSPGIPFSGLGVFNAQAAALAGQYKVVGVTGTTADQSISHIIEPGGFGQNDNLLFFHAATLLLRLTTVVCRTCCPTLRM